MDSAAKTYSSSSGTRNHLEVGIKSGMTPVIFSAQTLHLPLNIEAENDDENLATFSNPDHYACCQDQTDSESYRQFSTCGSKIWVSSSPLSACL
jgi:hypothetical protein